MLSTEWKNKGMESDGACKLGWGGVDVEPQFSPAYGASRARYEPHKLTKEPQRAEFTGFVPR